MPWPTTCGWRSPTRARGSSRPTTFRRSGAWGSSTRSPSAGGSRPAVRTSGAISRQALRYPWPGRRQLSVAHPGRRVRDKHGRDDNPNPRAGPRRAVAGEGRGTPPQGGRRTERLGGRPGGRLVARRRRPRLDGHPEVLLEPLVRLLVPDGDGRLGAAPRAALPADRDPFRRAVRLGRVDGRGPVVAALRRRARAARDRARHADG